MSPHTKRAPLTFSIARANKQNNPKKIKKKRPTTFSAATKKQIPLTYSDLHKKKGSIKKRPPLRMKLFFFAHSKYTLRWCALNLQ